MAVMAVRKTSRVVLCGYEHEMLRMLRNQNLAHVGSEPAWEMATSARARTS